MEITEEKLNKIVRYLNDNDIYARTCLSVVTDENGIEPTLLDRIYIDGEISFDLLSIIINDMVK